MRTPIILGILLVTALAVPTLFSPAAQASHLARIVMPSGQHERWIPVVAGYEVAPRPLGCDAGTITPSTVFYQQDFEGAITGVTFANNILQSHGGYGYRNLWHVTHSITNEVGTDFGHSGTGKLYFGNDATGLMRYGGSRLAGTVSFPAVTIGLEPVFLSWTDKFEVEGLFGYDHNWVEAVDVATGTVYILCSTDTDVRPDKSSHDGAFSTCSPYRTMLCPTGVQGDGGLRCPTAQTPVFGPCLPTFIDFAALGLHRVDPAAPHWENRYVQVPTELVGKTLVLRFSFDSADGVANGYMGFLADDIMISTGLPNPEPYAYVPAP